MINVTTRPGSVIDSPSRFATSDLSGNAVKDGFQRQQLGFGLGGALKQDKTFFYINVEQTFDRKDNRLVVPSLGVDEVVTGYNRFSYISGKIDQVWNGRFKTTLRANIGSFDIERQGGGLEGGILFPSAAAAQKNRTYLISLKNAYVIGDEITGETNYQHSRFRWNYREPVNPTNPSATVRGPNGVPIATIGQSGAIFDDIENTDQIQQKFTLRRGNHTLKAGAEFITSEYALLGGANPYGTYDVQLNQAQLDALKARNIGSALDVNDIPRDVTVRTYDVELRPTTFGTRQNVYSIYAEDLWAVRPDLNLTVGLRYDYDNLTKGGGNQGDFNNIAPRLAVNYQLTDRTVIRGGYGMFYDKIKYSVYSDNLQFSSSSADFKKELAELKRLNILPGSTDLNKVTFPGNLNARSTTPVTYLNGPTSDQLQARRDRWLYAQLRPWQGRAKSLFGVEGFIPYDVTPLGYLTHPEYFKYYQNIPVRFNFRPNDSTIGLAPSTREKPFLEVSYEYKNTPWRATYAYKTLPGFEEIVIESLKR